MANVRPRGGFQHFYFRPAIPGSGLTGKISFPAHITSLSDSSSPGWSENQDMGRADPKVFYASFSRNVSISFIVVSIDSNEHTENFDKLRKLGLLTYPIYSGGNGYNAPHVFFRVANLLQGYGYVTSFDMDWDADQRWIDDKPVTTNVSINIKVLGDGNGKRPEYNGGNYNYFGV